MKCVKCKIPAIEYIKFDENGVCEFCNNYEEKEYFNTDFYKILKETVKKSKSEYSCLVMASGGKDSTYALYEIVKKYGLKPLVLTFNNGFEPDEAIENVKKACEILNADFMYISKNDIKEIFRIILEEKVKVSPCHICNIWSTKLAFDTAKKFGINLIIAGWTKGQTAEGENLKIYEMFSEDSEKFIKKYLKSKKEFKSFPLSVNEVLNKNGKITVLSPHWFGNKSGNKKKEIIKKELQWKEIPASYPKNSTNCEFNFISSYLQLKFYNITHYHLEYSKLVRKNLLSGKKAEKMLLFDYDKEFLNKILVKYGFKKYF